MALSVGVRFPPTERAAAGVSMGEMFRELLNPLFLILFCSMFLTAAAELGYVPNPIAQSLVNRKTGVIGLVFPYSQAFTDRNPFSTQVIAGVFEGVVGAKYNLMHYTAVGDWDSYDVNTLLEPRVDGLILAIPSPDSEVVRRCPNELCPSRGVESLFHLRQADSVVLRSPFGLDLDQEFMDF